MSTAVLVLVVATRVIELDSRAVPVLPVWVQPGSRSSYQLMCSRSKRSVGLKGPAMQAVRAFLGKEDSAAMASTLEMALTTSGALK